MATKWRAAAIGAVLVAAAGPASAIFAILPKAPVERLLRNVDRVLEKSPDDPHLLYLKGRSHALAYARGPAAEVAKDPYVGRQASRDRDDEAEMPFFDRHESELLAFQGSPDDVRLGHLSAGIRALRRAADLAKPPEDAKRVDERPLLFLGLGWLLDDGSRCAPKLGHPEAIEVKDDLPEAERAEIDARIASLGAKEDDVRKRAYDALRSSFPRCWTRLVAQKDTKDEAVRTKVHELLVRWWQDQALDAYRRAYALARDAEVAQEYKFEETFDVSDEAGRAILRFLDGVPATDTTRAERKDIEKTLVALRKRGSAVTPILFPVSAPRPLADLLPPGRTSRFDIAGDGLDRVWPWPSADAAFLVWAPDPAEPVTSGRDLFGARTWWIFWRDGYEPLSMLDDDDDGRLAAAELEGIGVWRDLDGDGVSDPGEVVSAAAYGIDWIAVRATRTEDGVPAADVGIGLRDGSTRPTYDWTPHSLPEPAPQE